MKHPDNQVFHDTSLLTEEDLHLFNEGTHYQLYHKFGARPSVRRGASGYCFAVWAPNAAAVSVIGDFNDWHTGAHPLRSRGDSGIWEGFISGVTPGMRYKYEIQSRYNNYRAAKADPFALAAEQPPNTASLTAELDFNWSDTDWMAQRRSRSSFDAPVSIYEVHLGSWRRNETGDYLSYSEIAPMLTDYVKEAGFSHVELLPVMEHPFYGSWGYQVSGYFAPTSRYGPPRELMYLVDYLHRHDIGVILDWVPSHFPGDEHGLAYFDGTHLYEHSDPRRGFHPQWQSCIFNYGRREVISFLISSAAFWLEMYHADGLRVDGVASMLYLDYARQPGQWQPNRHGGRENLEAVDFIKQLNTELYRRFPDVHTFAEESTSWPLVSRPVHHGGLGFGYKWDMGWMHDTLEYFSQDPLYRSHHHRKLTFRGLYAFSENYLLPLSHDEVVHGKSSLLGRMPGDRWQQFANLRLLLTYMFTVPGKKLLFMGGEFGQRSEWQHDGQLDWELLESTLHNQLWRFVAALNHLYAARSALHQLDTEPGGFEWLEADEAAASIISFLRRGRRPDDLLLVILNLTPVPRRRYRCRVPLSGQWRVILSGDDPSWGGSGENANILYETEMDAWGGQGNSLLLDLPPLAGLILVPADDGEDD